MAMFASKTGLVLGALGIGVLQSMILQPISPAVASNSVLANVRGGACYNLSAAVNCATNPSTAGPCKNQLCGTDPMGYHSCTKQFEKGTLGGDPFSVVQFAPQGAAGKANGTNGQALCYTDYECQIGYFCDQDPSNVLDYYCKSNGKKINASYTMSGVLGGADCLGTGGPGGPGGGVITSY